MVGRPGATLLLLPINVKPREQGMCIIIYYVKNATSKKREALSIYYRGSLRRKVPHRYNTGRRAASVTIYSTATITVLLFVAFLNFALILFYYTVIFIVADPF